METIGEKLKWYREARKLTQTEVASAVNVSQGTYSQWEKDKYTPKISHLVKLAKVFDCYVEDLDGQLLDRYAGVDTRVLASRYMWLKNRLALAETAPDRERIASEMRDLDRLSMHVAEAVNKVPGSEEAAGGTSEEVVAAGSQGVDRTKFFPVIGMAAAAEVNTLSFPLAEYALEHAETYQYFPTGREGDFVLEVSGESMLPWYPPGTLLLIRPNQRLRTGTRVVAILGDGEVVFKVYGEKNGKIGLFSIDEGGKDFIFDAQSYGNIRGLYQVIASVRDEEKLDLEMTRAGIHHRWEEKINKL